MGRAEPMTFQQASERQYLRQTRYAVFLCGPAGEREPMGHTARKSGTGLMDVLWRPTVQERMRQFPGASDLRLFKHADRLEFGNGWSLRFGGTMRQEAE